MGEYPELTIGEVARRAGVATSSIRYYERIGLLPKPDRAQGQRRYDTRDPTSSGRWQSGY
jgi:MerR family redox-sensitive transcriptional activator SoxR